jgi:DNA-binding response OmpR family regulator/HPt (histidine-containing phosphotransfer) domain-containing protein
MKILLVEDDRTLAHTLQDMLEEQHYLVDTAFDGESGLDLATTYEYDLIVLDVMLPKQDGIWVCQKLRSRRNQVPILFLTAQGTGEQKVEGLDAGADDYMTKPFRIAELMARIRSLLRRGHSTTPPILEWQGLRLDPATGLVTGDNQLLPLTSKEHALVELFLRNPQRIFSQSALIDRLWDAENLPTENAVRAHIKSLRQKLRKVGLGNIIVTIFGLGYRLQQGDLDATAQEMATEQSDVPASEIDPPQWTNLWQQYRPEYIERAEQLSNAIAALKKGQMVNAEMLQQAQQQSHTLSGSLGSFGLERASKLAYQINQQLRQVELLKPTDIMHLDRLVQAIQQELRITTEDLGIEVIPPDEPSHPIRLLIVDDDPALAHQLASLAVPYGIQAQIECSPEHVKDRVIQWNPDVILLDLNFPDAPEAGFDLLRELSVQWLQLPVIVFTARDQYADRLKAAQLGGSVFLQKPVAPSLVIRTVLQVYIQSDTTQINLMQVNADVDAAKGIETLLVSWGFNWKSVDTVQQCWKEIPEFKPDLLLIDADLPSGSGFDLCRVVRSEPRWYNLPVIFMVSSLVPEVIRQICAVGGSACVVKPVAEADLISRTLYCFKNSARVPKLIG